VPVIDVESLPRRTGSGYPPPFDRPCATRMRRRLGEAAGLTDFGVNLLELPPGAWSSQRHWHSAEDEFVWVLSGAVVLIDDAGEYLLHEGDCAAFPRGDGRGHHLVNRGDVVARLLEVGSRRPREDACTYPDIDLLLGDRAAGYTHKDGTPYPPGR
jgi:uncharacterized cupin superfamily protein